MKRTSDWKAQLAIGIVCTILTFTIATLINSVRKNTATEKTQQLRTEELQLELGREKEKIADLNIQLYTAQNDLKQFREEAEDSDGYAKVLSEQLSRSEVLAGLTQVAGPGIKIMLADSVAESPLSATTEDKEKLLIHDGDLRLVMTELAAAGAEAYSINGQRIIATSPIRCVGPVITVNEHKMAPPFEILAIGEPKTLEAAVNMRGGLKDLFESVSIEISVTTEENLVIPRYTNPIYFKHANPTVEQNGGGQ